MADTIHYFSEKQESALRKKRISVFLRGNRLEFYTGSGVFSRKRIDNGTELLINSALIEDALKILDFGCGYGAVGIAVAKAYPKCRVTMVDVNERAVELAKENIKINSLKNASAIKSNFVEKVEDADFDVVLLNPPQTAGKEVCYKMIADSYNQLKKNGTLQLVARHNKGGKSLEKKMKESFGNVKAIAKSAGYRVYLSEK